MMVATQDPKLDAFTIALVLLLLLLVTYYGL